MTWQALGGVAPSELRSAREQAHWGVQLIAAAGETFAPHAPDTSHTAASWDAARGALVGQALAASVPARLGLRVADAVLLVLGDARAPAAEIALVGRTLAEASEATSRALARHTRGELEGSLRAPDYALPPHPLADGGRFARDAGLAELARWYGNADGVLRQLSRETPGAGPVLCWPHHFDMASLAIVASDSAGQPTSTVGLGLSPGDASIDLPYAYVNHWPETRRAELPPLTLGAWFREGWIGAVLRGDDIVAAGGAAAQETRLRSFLAAAFAASRPLALERGAAP